MRPASLLRRPAAMSRPSVPSIVAAFQRDGVPGLEALLERAKPTAAWLDDLIAAVSEGGSATAVTWMLRATLQRGIELDRRQVAALVRGLRGLEVEDARLHVCQSVVHLDVPSRSAEPLARFLRDCAGGEAKFTRAWAVDAFHRLALQHERYRREALDLLDRARRLRKESGYGPELSP